MKKSNLLGMLCLGISTFGLAQEADSTKVQQLDEVVVSDSRFNLKREHSGKTVIKISKEELERNQGKTVSDLINTKSGIEINGSRSVEGQNLGYYIRGGNNRQVLILIDGIAVSDPSSVFNDFDLRLLDINIIECIEIIKGAASTLYGNAAATAVIQITTKKPSGKRIEGNFLTVVGTNQSQNDDGYRASAFNNMASINGTLGQLSYNASFGNRYTDGLSAAKSETPEKDVFSKYNTSLSLGYTAKNFVINVFGSYDNLKTDIDGFPPPNYTLSDTDDYYFSEQKRIGVNTKFEYQNGSVQVNASFHDFERETISDLSSLHKAKSYGLEALNKHKFGENLHTIVGLNYGNYESEFVNEESFSNIDPFLNMVYISDFGLNINAGSRLHNHSEYGSYLVYNINPSYRLKPNYGIFKIFGSYATSFIAPNLSQLFGYFGPNPNLEPEKNKTLEAGIEFSGNTGFRMSSLFFNRDEKHTIIYTSTYENATADATVQGAEIELAFNPFKNLSFQSNYTYVQIQDGERLKIPKHKTNVALGYRFGTSSFASISHQFIGKRKDFDFQSFQNIDLKAFHLVDLYFSQKMNNETIKVFANITNLFNADYFEILGYTTKGRNVSLGLNIKL